MADISKIKRVDIDKLIPYENNAKCIAEAVADFYCNGSKARKESKAIMSELKRLAKVEPMPFS